MIRTVLEAAVALSSLNSAHTQTTPLQPEDPAITGLTLPFFQNTTCPNPDYSLELLAPRVEPWLETLTHLTTGAATGMIIMTLPALTTVINNRDYGDSLLKIGAMGSVIGATLVLAKYNVEWGTLAAFPVIATLLAILFENTVYTDFFISTIILTILAATGSFVTSFSIEKLGIPGALSTAMATIVVILTAYLCLIKKADRDRQLFQEVDGHFEENWERRRQMGIIPQQNQVVNWDEREFVQEEVRNGRNMIMAAGRVQAVIAPRIGATPEDLERIMNQMFHLGTRITSEKDTSEDKVCSICFSRFLKDQLVFSHDTENGVAHTFHSECIRDWATVQLSASRTVNCPACRVLFI